MLKIKWLTQYLVSNPSPPVKTFKNNYTQNLNSILLLEKKSWKTHRTIFIRPIVVISSFPVVRFCWTRNLRKSMVVGSWFTKSNFTNKSVILFYGLVHIVHGLKLLTGYGLEIKLLQPSYFHIYSKVSRTSAIDQLFWG